MSASAIRNHLETALNGVTNIGVVHDYERFKNDYTDFLALFKTTIGGSSVIRGWSIAYDGFTTERADFDPGVFRAHAFTLRGFLGWDDSTESEKTAQDLGEAVCNALDDDTNLHSTANYFDCSESSLNKEARMFGGVLCHALEIKMTVTEYRA